MSAELALSIPPAVDLCLKSDFLPSGLHANIADFQPLVIDTSRKGKRCVPRSEMPMSKYQNA